jgi:hypothetical protein
VTHITTPHHVRLAVQCEDAAFAHQQLGNWLIAELLFACARLMHHAEHDQAGRLLKLVERAVKS